MAGTAKVECPGLAPLRKSEDVKKSPLDIQIASDCEYSHINRNLKVVLEAEYTDEDEYCTETSNEKHAAPYRPVFGTIKLGDQARYEAAECRCAHKAQPDPSH